MTILFEQPMFHGFNVSGGAPAVYGNVFTFGPAVTDLELKVSAPD